MAWCHVVVKRRRAVDVFCIFHPKWK
jgi:ribosomal protein L36